MAASHKHAAQNAKAPTRNIASASFQCRLNVAARHLDLGHAVFFRGYPLIASSSAIRRGVIDGRRADGQQEREGFEPSKPAKVQRFSRPPHSTALPPLQVLASTQSDFSESPADTAIFSPFLCNAACL